MSGLDGALPPVPINSNSIGLATAYANDQLYLFYYDKNDNNLHMAKGKENAGFNGNAIAIGKKPDFISINQQSTPTPLAAGYNSATNVLRVFFVQSDFTIGELKSLDQGNTWNYGGLTSKFSVAQPGGLTASVGDIWRIVIVPQGNTGTLMVLYETSPDSWSSYAIP